MEYGKACSPLTIDKHKSAALEEAGLTRGARYYNAQGYGNATCVWTTTRRQSREMTHSKSTGDWHWCTECAWGRYEE